MTKLKEKTLFITGATRGIGFAIAKKAAMDGANIVIAANHMLRAAYPAMLNVAKSILENGRSFEAEHDCMSVKEILRFIPGTE